MIKKFSKFYHWEYFWLCVILLVSLACHFAVIDKPPQPIFDEQHYIPDARSIISNHATIIPEHPPLGKLFIAAGIKLFGDNPWGWRFFSVIFGGIGIILLYFISKKLEFGKVGASLVTFLFAFENMAFVQSGLAMLDVYFVTLMLAAFLFYLNHRYTLAGIVLGLSLLAKVEAIYGLFALGIYWLFDKERSKQAWLVPFFAFVSFIVLMIPLDFAVTGNFTNLPSPLSRIQTMLSVAGKLTFNSVAAITDSSIGAASRPWEWLLSWRPLQYWHDPHYLGAISFTIFAFALPAFIYMVYKTVKGSKAGLFGAALFIGTYLITIPLSLLTNRISYIYYFYPAIGAVCLDITLCLSDMLNAPKFRSMAILIVAFVVLAHIASFVILSPVF